MRLDRSASFAQIFIASCLVASSSVQAQIVPDGTLGGEQSRVVPMNPTTERIEGGALRGVNLFHSFLEFNVGAGRGAYFANPETVQNIFSRVTGSNLSKIDGTLGVLGRANLFLLNPNGIIFGPNARLAIAGSFFASTASGFKFSDGSEFSATNPQAAPLLMVDLTPGLQRGGTPGAIVNAGSLTVERDLTLSSGTVTSTGLLAAPQGQVAVEATVGDARVRDVMAQTATLYANNNLILEESQLRTTGDLNLLAQNTVRVRDSVANPFLAQASGNLLIQGNQGIDILALNHPQTPFVSGGNLSLVSDGNISGDAHFSSGSNFSILNLSGKPGKFVSLHDPVISANGDVNFSSYTGVSLKVEATRSIFVDSGNPTNPAQINITGADNGPIAVGTNPIALSDVALMRSSPALILRAGTVLVHPSPQDRTVQQGFPSPQAGSPPTSFNPGSVTLPQNVVLPEGSIWLNGSISTGSSTGNSGPVILDARGGVEVRGNIDATATAPLDTTNYLGASNGGAITITAGRNITVRPITSDGAIIISSPTKNGLRDPIIVNNQFNVETFNNGNGGDITFKANGEIRVEHTLIYNNSGIATGFNYNEFDLSDVGIRTGATVETAKSGNIKFEGGTIRLSSSRLDSSVYGNGTPGNIILDASQNDILLSGTQILSSNYANPFNSTVGNQGQPPRIQLKGNSVSLSRSNYSDPYFYYKSILDSSNHGSGIKGDISIDARGSITIDGSTVTSTVRSTASGQGGSISITSQNNSIFLTNLASVSASTSGTGTGGDVTVQSLVSNSTISISSGSRIESRTFGVGDRVKSGPDAGRVAPGGDAGDVVVNAPNVIVSGSAKFYNQDFFSGVLTSSDTAKSGQGGSIYINKDISPIGRALLIEGGGFLSALNRSYIADGKNIEVNVDELKLINGGQIITATEGIKNAGGIIINAPKITISGTNPSLQNINAKNSFLFQTPEGQTFNGQYFSTGSDSNTDFSTTIPHATFYRVGRGEYDFYQVTVTTGNRVIFDTDNDLKSNSNDARIPADTQLFLFNSSGGLLATNDDSLKDNGSRGDSGQLDSYLDYTFTNSGNYILGVGKYFTQVNPQGRVPDNTLLIGETPGSNELYTLQVSINSQNTLNPNRFDADGISRSGLFSGGDAIGGGAGQLIINGRGSGQVTIEKGGQILASTVSGTGSNISLQGLSTLNISDGSIVASTINGKAGSLTLNKDSVPAQTVTLTNSTVSLAARNGFAGSIALNAQQLTLENGSEITASTESGIGGGVTLEGLSTLKVNNSLISATTNAKAGSAGNLTVNAPDGLVELNGPRPDGTTGGLSVQANNGGTAGRLDVVTQSMNVRNGAQVSVSSPEGQAGNLSITAGQLTLDNGKLIALTGASSQNGETTGNITLQGLRALFMKNESLISATANAGANGGNVNIAANFIFGFSPTGPNGSDISANADLGRGGIVKIDRTAIFGLTYRSKLTPLNDITATSNVGLQGTVTFTGIDVDPTRGLSPLPIETRDPSNLIDQSCSPSSGEKQTSQYTNTGRGGLPPSPDDSLNTDTTLAQLATPVLQSANRSSQVTLPPPDNKSPDAIVEAQGWMKLPNGRIRLITQAPTVTPHGNWQPPFGCVTPQGTRN